MAKLAPRRYGDKPEDLAPADNYPVNKIELIGVRAEHPTVVRWGDTVHVIVHPMLDEDGNLIRPDTPKFDAAVEKAAQEARDKGAKSVTLGYDIGLGEPAKPPGQPLPQITYNPPKPPADLSPEAWGRIARVSALIEEIAPSDEMPEGVFGAIEGFLRSQYLSAAA
jgi:hypothetical protein